MLRKHLAATAWLLTLALSTGCPQPADSAGIEVENPGGILDDFGFPAPDTFEARLQTDFPGCDEPADAEQVRSRILALVNRARAGEGIPPVRANLMLQNQASQYACEMVDGEFFGHENPYTGSTLSVRANSFGYEYTIVGENLAAGQPTPEQAFADWMDSPSHRANIMDPRFTELGIGVREGGYYGIYYVQEFGHPAN